MYRNGKIINSANEAAVKRYEKAVDNYSNILKLELLQEIGYEYDPVTGKYTGNLQDFLDVVQRELDRRDLPEHLVQLVGLNRDNSLKTDLSIHLVADEIEAILVALVEKRLIKQKVKGEALVQVASSMSNGLWDSNLKKGTDAEVRKFLGTNNLPFYNRDSADGKTNAMKVAIALQGDFSKLLKVKHLDGQPIGTRARLNDMIKSEDWLNIGNNRKAVTLSAVRIPVQGLNSMEFMEVYEFLDPAAGNIIIPPTEIVAKSGADFDVDKLTTFMPTLDSNGEFVETGLTNDQVLAKVNNTDDANAAAGLIKNQKAALENELISSIRNILELNDNYAALVKPNDTYLLKDDIADKIQDNVIDYNRFQNMHKESERIGKKGNKVISPTRTLEASYNLHKHEVNMIGKRVLGMIAVENSLHPVMNSIGASLPAKYKNVQFSPSLQRNVEGSKSYQVRLMLPHNKTDDGRVSLSGTDTVDGLDNIAELFSQMMNGAVDVEKDAWIFFIQGNYEITPMITFLLKAGVPKEHAILFVSNPIVREYAKQQRMLKSAYAKVTGTVEEDFENTMVKYQAAVNALKKFGDDDGINKVTNKKYYHAVTKATSASGILNKDNEFDIELMKKLVKNPDAPELQKHAQAMFLHFIELEKASRGFTSLKFLSNPDTKTSKTLQEIIRRNLNVEDAKALSSLEKGTVEAMQDSILGSFFDNKLIGDLIVPVFLLRNNDTVTNFVLEKAKKNSAQITRTFGSGQDGVRNFITAYKNAVPTYIFQNYMTNFIDENGNLTSMPKEYKGMEVITRPGVKNGVEVIDGKLYVDKTRLEKEYKNSLFTRSSTVPGNYTSNGLRGFGNIEGLFPNESTYFKYVFERENQRSMYSLDSVQTNKDYLRLKELIKDDKQAYEAYLNQRALINAFNRKVLMDFDGQSYTDLVLNMIEDYPTLASKYSILSQFTKPKIATGEEVLSLNDVSALKDPQLAEIYYQNLKDLADVTIKKVSNPEDNTRISKLFSMLPLVAIYQHGIGYSKYGFNKALPYTDFVGIMQNASDIFMNKQLNEATLETIFEKLIDPKNRNFKDYVVSPKAYASPEPVAVVEEDTISEEEAGALLERMGVQSVEEAENMESIEATNIKEVIPAYGAVQVSTNPTKEFDTYLTDVISDNIKNNAYVENGSSSANLMFSYGWQWKGNNSKKVIGDKLIVQPAEVDFSGKGNPVAVKSRYFYDSKYNDGTPVPDISELDFLKKHIENNLGIDMSDYDIALNNIYTQGTNLFRHTDIDESNTAKNYPVVVYVLGNEHKVRIDDNGGGAVRGMGEMVNPKTLTLKNGDIYTFGMNGKGRFEAVHDVVRTNKTDDSFPPITLPDGRTIKNYTVTFTFRRAADLEPGMPTEPAKLTTKQSTQSSTQQQAEVKEGVEELFNENPKLATEVYQALGFTRSDKVLSENYENYFEEIQDMNSAIFDNLENADLLYPAYTIQELDIDTLNISKKTAGYSDNASDYLKNDLKSIKDQKTPILINGRGEVVEGWHRIHSLKANGVKTIKAYVPITPQQKQQALQVYSQYLDTIFPNSQVKDIVYHGSKKNLTLESFDKSQIGTSTDLGWYGKGFYFFFDPQSAKYYGKLNTAILNIKNPYLFNSVKSWTDLSKTGVNIDNLQKISDGVLVTTNLDEYLDNADLEKLSKKVEIIGYSYQDSEGGMPVIKLTKDKEELVVFEPEQIHILGSKQDIEGFKKFVAKSPTDLSSTKSGKKQQELQNVNKTTFKINISNTLQQFLEPFFNSQDDSIVEPFAEKLTNEDKQILAKAIRRNYKDINQFDWYEAIWSDVGQEEVFYYLKTGNQLEQDIQKNYLNSKLYKDYQNFVKENKEFVDNFRNLPKEIQQKQQKDLDKLKEKDSWFHQQIGEFEYNERGNLLKKEGYVENNINLENLKQTETNNNNLNEATSTDNNVQETPITGKITDVNAPEGLPGIPRSSTDCQ